MNAFKSDEGKWYVSNAAGDVVAGPFDHQSQALDWIKAQEPPRPRMRA